MSSTEWSVCCVPIPTSRPPRSSSGTKTTSSGSTAQIKVRRNPGKRAKIQRDPVKSSQTQRESRLKMTSFADFPRHEDAFKISIQEYLFSPHGRHYLNDIKTNGSILDLKGNFTITASLRWSHFSLTNIFHQRDLKADWASYS